MSPGGKALLEFPPDWTFFVQIALFLGLWLVLKRLLFDPVGDVLQERKRRGEGTAEEARQIRARAEQTAGDYRRELSAARTRILAEVEEMYRREEDQARVLLAEARDAAAADLRRARDLAEREAREARAALRARTPEFAAGMAEKLLGRPLTQA